MSKGIDFSLRTSKTEFVTEFRESDISLFVKREDLLHPEVSGNKFRKLKYNLQQAKEQAQQRLLTFGGAFSNHIAAVAAAGQLMGFKTTGVIRGEELGLNPAQTLADNPTLRFAASCGMEFLFVSREAYRQKESSEFLEDLKDRIGDFYLLPEGGTNKLAVKGCEEILETEEQGFDFVCCPAGTGGTIAGIINSSAARQEILGFPALKGNFLKGEISKYTNRKNWNLITDYHFGGYGKISEELVNFMNDFYRSYGLLLDPVYTGKMFFGIFDLIRGGRFPENSRILAVHTGGLQGIPGMNNRLRKKNFPLIEYADEV